MFWIKVWGTSAIESVRSLESGALDDWVPYPAEASPPCSSRFPLAPEIFPSALAVGLGAGLGANGKGEGRALRERISGNLPHVTKHRAP